MNIKDLRPTQAYPKILWYQIKKPRPSEKDQKIIYNNHYTRILTLLTKNFPSATQYDLVEAAIEQAKDMAYKEIHKPEALMKVVVNNTTEFYKMTALIENSDNFIQWYKK